MATIEYEQESRLRVDLAARHLNVGGPSVRAHSRLGRTDTVRSVRFVFSGTNSKFTRSPCPRHLPSSPPPSPLPVVVASRYVETLRRRQLSPRVTNVYTNRNDSSCRNVPTVIGHVYFYPKTHLHIRLSARAIPLPRLITRVHRYYTHAHACTSRCVLTECAV